MINSKLWLSLLMTASLLVAFIGSTSGCNNVSSGKIAFVSDRDGDPYIYVTTPDGSTVINITNTPDIDDYSPIWSPK